MLLAEAGFLWAAGYLPGGLLPRPPSDERPVMLGALAGRLPPCIGRLILSGGGLRLSVYVALFAFIRRRLVLPHRNSQPFTTSEQGRLHHQSPGWRYLIIPRPKLPPNSRRHILMESSIDGEARACWAI